MPFKIDEVMQGDAVVLVIHGQLADEHSVEFRDTVTRLLKEGKHKIVVDLSDCTFINSMGLGALVSAYTRTANTGGNIVLANLSKKFSDVLQNTKLTTVFEVYDSRDVAVEGLSKTKSTGVS